MTRIEAKILRDAALRPTGIEVKNLKVDYEYYPGGAVSKIILSGRRASIPRLFEVLDMIYPRDITVSVRGSEWFDRNPKSISDEYDDDVNPHAETERLTYTVPSDRIALIEVLSINITQTVAATAGGFANARWYVTPNGESETRFFTVTLANLTAVITGRTVSKTIGSTIPLFDGDKFVLKTSMFGTAGTMAVECGYKLTEFDA